MTNLHVRARASAIGACVVFVCILFGFKTAAVPLTDHVTGGFTNQSWRIDNSDGSYDIIHISDTVDLTFYPSIPSCTGTNFVSSTVTNISGSIHIWGDATRYNPNPTTINNYDNTYNYGGGPLSVAAKYEGQTGQGGVQDLTWQIATSGNQNNAWPYYIHYYGSAQLLRLWIALPYPFWYSSDLEYYDSTGTAAISGQQNVPSNLQGTVTDAVSGQGIAGAQVKFGNVPQTADNSGSFNYQTIPSNTYQLIVTNLGYASTTNLIFIPAFIILHTNITLFPNTNVITFYHEPPYQSLAGHVFLSVVTPTGAKKYYGFFPSGFVISSPGRLVNDKDTAWDYAISYPLTPSQYLAVARTITKDRASPPDYTLFDFNCMAWAAKVASSASIVLPPYQWNGIPSDGVFGNSLTALGSGANCNGGTVIKNPSSSLLAQFAPNNITVFPYDLSYTGVEMAGHTNASNLATDLGLQFDQVNLGTLNANSTNGITLNLTGVYVSQSLVSVNWGDGSPYQEQSLSPSHVYTNGTYSADLLVVDNGAVHSFNFTVIVSASPATVTNILVGTFPPVSIPNQGLQTADVVPDYPLPLAQSILFDLNRHAITTFTGAPGETYQIQTTTNLIQPFFTVTNIAAGTNGVFIYDDPTASNKSRAFYRALIQ